MGIPSLKTIDRHLGKVLTHAHGRDAFAAAKQIRQALERADGGGREDVDRALDDIDRILGYHGVEAVRAPDHQVDRYYFDIVALYCNSGDSYAPTVLYDTAAHTFHVTSWGDWVEKAERTKRYTFA